MSSSYYIPAKDEPDSDKTLEALREAIFDTPHLGIGLMVSGPLPVA